MLMKNSKDDLERHKAATVSLVPPPPPPKQPAIITTPPTSNTNNFTTMSTAVTEPHLSSLQRSHTVTSSVSSGNRRHFILRFNKTLNCCFYTDNGRH